MDFKSAFTLLTGPTEEGGYVDNRADPGGKTRYGITEVTARKHGYTGAMDTLPLAMAQDIYLKDYWGPAGCDALPDNMKYPMFAFYVNAPPRAAVKALQLAAGMGVNDQDGSMGPHTLQAVNSAAATPLGALRMEFRFSLAKQLYYTGCFDWPAFGRGWTIREANNVLNRPWG